MVDILTEYDRKILNATSKNYKTCKQCGKVFFVASPSDYAYKNTYGRNCTIAYFCGYSCCMKSKRNGK